MSTALDTSDDVRDLGRTGLRVMVGRVHRVHGAPCADLGAGLATPQPALHAVFGIRELGCPASRASAAGRWPLAARNSQLATRNSQLATRNSQLAVEPGEGLGRAVVGPQLRISQPPCPMSRPAP